MSKETGFESGTPERRPSLMNDQPDILPSQDTVEAAWQAYADLVRARQGSAALETDLSHSIAIARAWSRWQHLFLAREAA